MKAVISARDDRILGFTMIGSEAGEVMAAVQTAMLGALPYTRLRDAIFTHLTMAEGLGPLLGNAPPRVAQGLQKPDAVFASEPNNDPDDQ